MALKLLALATLALVAHAQPAVEDVSKSTYGDGHLAKACDAMGSKATGADGETFAPHPLMHFWRR